jgi:hypothetical protein
MTDGAITVVQCERCGAGPSGADLFDYCGLCGQALCDDCMATGCCGQSPAVSGRTQDDDRAADVHDSGAN